MPEVFMDKEILDRFQGLQGVRFFHETKEEAEARREQGNAPQDDNATAVHGHESDVDSDQSR